MFSTALPHPPSPSAPHRTPPLHVHRDHSWRPFGAEALDALPAPLKFMRFSLFVLLLWPVYLLAPRHDYGFSGCHFWPWNPLFKPEERAGVAVSALAVVGMMGLLSACATEYGLVRPCPPPPPHTPTPPLGDLKLAPGEAVARTPAERGGTGGWRNGLPCRALCFV